MSLFSIYKSKITNQWTTVVFFPYWTCYYPANRYRATSFEEAVAAMPAMARTFLKDEMEKAGVKEPEKYIK